MINNVNIDNVLSEVLSEQINPDKALNQKLLAKFQNSSISKAPVRRLSRLAIVTIALLLTSMTAFAVTQFLTPSEVIEEMDNQKLAELFENEGILINESEIAGEYKITLMGMADGEYILSEELFGEDINTHIEKGCFMIAIEKVNGEGMPELSELANPEQDPVLSVTPIVKGMAPWDCAGAISPGLGTIINHGGIWYYVMSYGSVLPYIDDEVYLAVYDGMLFPNEQDKNAYDYDEVTGEITQNPNYIGTCNILFDVTEYLEFEIAEYKAGIE